MSSLLPRHPVPARTPFNLASITHGMRLLTWVMRLSGLLWVEEPFFRKIAELAAVTGAQPRVAWHGPLNPARVLGTPLLCWFEVAVTDRTISRSLITALNCALQDSPETPPPDIDELVARTVTHWGSRTCDESPEGHELNARRSRQPAVVIIDERARTHDCTRRQPCARREAFGLMLAAASEHHRDAEMWLVRSTDAASGPWLSDLIGIVPSAVKLGQHYDSCFQVLRQARHVYTMGASEGLLALLSGASVHVFGEPYYAGWGLTEDFFPVTGRLSRPTLRAFFHALFAQLVRYLDPVTLQPGSIRSLLDILDVQHSVARRFDDIHQLAGIGFQLWKRPLVTPFLTAGRNRLRWIGSPTALRDGETAVLWGANSRPGLSATMPSVRIEDGFLHSAGLGSDLSAPQSQVIDRRGIYVDPTAPNDLVELLNIAGFHPPELRRAAQLREQIVCAGVTKYNLGRRRPQWQRPPEVMVVLVVGQVEDDASVRFGCPQIRTAEELLRTVRATRPRAWIVYRPHPDALAGNRKGCTQSMGFANVVDAHSDIISLIAASDEVHTLTSLAGFDALVRGKAVFTYGMPFYSGWGLTHDAVGHIPHRDRTLTLDMLVAGALIRYPVYWDWRLRLYTTPEATVARLAAPASRDLATVRPSPARALFKTWRWARNVTAYMWRSFTRLSARGVSYLLKL